MTTAQPTSKKRRIVIIAAPPHDHWPIYLREQCVGLALPIEIDTAFYGFESTSYVVKFDDFLSALEEHAPEMAEWQQNYTTATMTKETHIILPKNICKEVPFPSALHDLTNQDLAGYTIMTGHYLVLTHGLWGVFPTRIAATKQMVICTNTDALTLVVNSLPARPHHTEQLRCLVHLVDGYGFSLEASQGFYTSRLPILSVVHVEQLFKTETHPFEWTPGILL